MLLIHPIIQILATLIALYVLKLGVARFQRLHLHLKTIFYWKRHVALGKLALMLWLLGVMIGFIMVKTQWNGLLLTGSHGQRALIIVPLLIFGFCSGWYMDKRKKQRSLLPFVHAAVNILLLVMALLQAITGWQVYETFVLGN